MARKKKELFVGTYTITFDSDGAHMVGVSGGGDCGHTIARWKFPKLKARLNLKPEMDLYTFLWFWPHDQAETLHQVFIDLQTDGAVYWDQDEWDRYWGTVWD